MLVITRGIEYRLVVETDDPDFCIYEAGGKAMTALRRHVICSDYENMVVIASACDTDARLLTSNYFKDRQNTWFNHEGKHTLALSRKDAAEFALTQEEQALLDFMLKELECSYQVKHGWYDVLDYK